METHLVRTCSDSSVTAGTVVFRHGGALYVTAVVKATFAFVPSGTAARVAPLPIEREERSTGVMPVMGIDAASDLAPYVPGVGVTFRGHAYAPAGQTVPACSVRLALYRERATLLEKTLHVFGDVGKDGARKPFSKMPIGYDRAFGGPGTSNPAGSASPNVVYPDDRERPAGFGPISRHWPDRKRLLASVNRENLAKPIAELPDPMPWEYYQAAPPDQRVPSVLGGEWVVLDGLHPSAPRLSTAIPVVAVAARLFDAATSVAEGTPFELSADTLVIDGDRETISIVWRGRTSIPGREAALPGLVVAAGIDMPGRPIDWSALRASAAPPPAAQPAWSSGPAATLPVEETRVFTGSAPELAIPFSSRGPLPAARAPNAEATPWGRAPTSVRPAPAAAVEGTIAAPPGEMTLVASPASQSRPITPFAAPAQRSGPPPSAPAPSVAIPGAPWSPERAAPLPRASAVEGTIATSAPLAVMAMPAPIAAPPAPAYVVPAPAPAPAPASAPASAPVSARPRRVPVMVSAPNPKPPPTKPPPVSKDAAGLASRLGSAGVNRDQIRTLVDALKPTLAPPEEE